MATTVAPRAAIARSALFSLDHKVIARQYFTTATIFFLLAGTAAELIRVQLSAPTSSLLSNAQYNAAFTLHGSAMIWFVAIPLLTGGFGNLLLPLMIGARDVAFPWLNLVAFWLFPLSGLVLVASVFSGAPQDGWTEYPPFSTGAIAPPGTTLWALAIALSGISSTLTGINFLTTVIRKRAPGMTLRRMPLFVWAIATASFLLFVATTALTAALLALLAARIFGVAFFDPTRGGSPVLWQHLFWFYSHPAVYIVILPAFGIVSEIIPTFARRPIFGYTAIVLSTVAIGLLSFMVWVHHMFTSGVPAWESVPFMIMTMIVAVPTGVKIFSWIASLWAGKLRFDTPMLFILGFLVTFTVGGITGVIQAILPLDSHLHGSYFLVAHFHYVMFGGAIFTVFAGVYYWFPKLAGRRLDEGLGKVHFWMTFVFTNLTFLPMHWLGLMGMPRWVSTYDPRFAQTNAFVSLASYGLVLGVAIFVYNVVQTLASGARAPINPWGARTLEWMTDSPPIEENFATIPTVTGAPYDYTKPLPYEDVPSRFVAAYEEGLRA